MWNHQAPGLKNNSNINIKTVKFLRFTANSVNWIKASFDSHILKFLDYQNIRKILYWVCPVHDISNEFFCWFISIKKIFTMNINTRRYISTQKYGFCVKGFGWEALTKWMTLNKSDKIEEKAEPEIQMASRFSLNLHCKKDTRWKGKIKSCGARIAHRRCEKRWQNRYPL